MEKGEICMDKKINCNEHLNEILKNPDPIQRIEDLKNLYLIYLRFRLELDLFSKTIKDFICYVDIGFAENQILPPIRNLEEFDLIDNEEKFKEDFKCSEVRAALKNKKRHPLFPGLLESTNEKDMG